MSKIHISRLQRILKAKAFYRKTQEANRILSEENLELVKNKEFEQAQKVFLKKTSKSEG